MRVPRRAWLAPSCSPHVVTAQRHARGQDAERAGDFDRAVVSTHAAIRQKPGDRERAARLERVRVRASQAHFFRGRRLVAAERTKKPSLNSSSPRS